MTTSISSPWRSEGSPTNSIGLKIEYEDIVANPLTSHYNFEDWREFLFDYLRQEGLTYVIHSTLSAPLGLHIRLQDRTGWIDRMVDEAKVKSILLQTIPLHKFMAYKDESAYNIFRMVSTEYGESANREAVVEGRGKKRKRDDV